MRIHQPEPIELYKFEELDDKAKERAIRQEYDSRCVEGNPWGSEWISAWEAIKTEFHINDRGNKEYATWINPDEGYWDDNITGEAAWQYVKDNWGSFEDCPWTGFCADESFLDPIRKWVADMKSRPDWETLSVWELIKECVRSFKRCWDQDNEDYYSDEQITEYLIDDPNNYEYTKEGIRYTP